MSIPPKPVVRIVVAGRYHLHNWTRLLNDESLFFEVHYSYKKTEWCATRQIKQMNVFEREFAFRLINKFFPHIPWDKYLPILARYFDIRTRFAKPPGVLHFVCNGTVLETVQRAKSNGALLVADCIGVDHAFRDRMNQSEERRGRKAARSTPILSSRMRRELALADIIICPSEFAAATYRQAGVSCPIHVLPYGVPCDKFSPHGDRERFLRDSVMRIVCTASLCANKGQFYLLEAAERAKRRGLNLSVHLVGTRASHFDIDVSHYSFPIELVSHIENSQLQMMYSDKHLFCLPTLYEGMSIAQLEAMAAGLPLLTTTNSGLPADIQNGCGVLVVAPQDVSALSNALMLLGMDRARLQEMANTNANYASMVGGWSSYAHSVQKLYRQLLKQDN